MDTTILLPGLAALNIWEASTLYHGGDQEWYPDDWQRKAGCGPTNCTNILWYLAKTRTGCEALCQHDASQKQGFIQLMEEVWQYVTPGNMGVNSTAVFVEGAKKYGQEKGIALEAKTFEVARICKGKREYSQVSEFIRTALQQNQPVAFLNLSNGTLDNLDSWHWVTIVGLQGEKAMIFDQGEAKWINLAQWLATSIIGGGFVTLEKA